MYAHGAWLVFLIFADDRVSVFFFNPSAFITQTIPFILFEELKAQDFRLIQAGLKIALIRIR